jgi:hypothetical protein
LLQWNSNSHGLVQSKLQMGIYADGDVRDVLQVQTTNRENLIIISKNNDSVQVIKSIID